MKIFIIGAGAIGKALSVFLHNAGKDVLLVRGSVNDEPEHSETLRVEINSGKVLSATINVSSIARLSLLDGLVVLTNKSFGNARLAQLLKQKTGSSPVIILQNGLNVERPFIEAGFQHIYRCVLFVTAQINENNIVRFRPVTLCPVGRVRDSADNATQIASALNTAQFCFKPEQDIEHVIWKKTIANCVFNSICPLLDIDNGIFHRNSEALYIAKNIITECIDVAKAFNIALNSKEVTDSLLQISQQSDGQFISTLQDIRNGRETEIDTLNIEIARMADEMNIPVPQTRLLGKMIQLKSSR